MPEARVVPYDSPHRYLGDIQRLWRVVHSLITSATDSMSAPYPWNSLDFSPLMAREYPVDTGSMNTRSECLSKVWLLSAMPYGGGSKSPASPISTRRGPSRPRCSQMLDEPGPPLNANVTGRAGVPSLSRTYEVTNTSAFGWAPSN